MKTTFVFLFVSIYFCVNLNAQTFKPTHKVVIEDQTMCSTDFAIYCPRGIVFVDSFAESDQYLKSEIISVHANYPPGSIPEPMFDSLYYMGCFTNTHLKATAWPQIVVDRKMVTDPDSIFYDFDLHTSDSTVADISVMPMYNDNTRALDVTVSAHFAVNTSHCNLALVLTEDSVHHTTCDYDQRNKYAGGGTGPMYIGDMDFTLLPDTIPAEMMYYRHVARTILPSFAGKAGSLPSVLKADSIYSYTFPTYTIPYPYRAARMRAIILLINTQTGEIMNANGANIPNATDAVDNIQPSAASLTVFPNPFTEKTSVNIALASSSHVTLEVTNMLGERMTKEDLGFIAAGEHSLTLNKGTMPAGMYLITITTDQARFMQKVLLSK
jgi:hypothetical protein